MQNVVDSQRKGLSFCALCAECACIIKVERPWLPVQLYSLLPYTLTLTCTH